FFRSLWQPSAFRPPGWAEAATGASNRSAPTVIVAIFIRTSPNENGGPLWSRRSAARSSGGLQVDLLEISANRLSNTIHEPDRDENIAFHSRPRACRQEADTIRPTRSRGLMLDVMEPIYQVGICS